MFKTKTTTLQVDKDYLESLQIGDFVCRMISGIIPMKLKVTKIDDQFIYCGPWKFSKITGAEIDEGLGWDKDRTGSYIILREQ